MKWTLWLALAGTSAIVGCGAPSQDDESEMSPAVRDAIERGDDNQQDAVQDGSVSFAEYEQAFLLFQACMREAGQPLTEIELDRATELYSYVTPSADDPLGCYVRTFQAVDMLWQRNAARPGNSDVATVLAMRDCLARAGADVTATPDDELLASLAAYGIDLRSCVDGYTDGSSQ